jgi:hypothetical protein
MVGYSEGREEEKKKKEEREKQRHGVFYGVSPLSLLMGPSVVRGMETGIIPKSYLSLEQHAFPVNPDETPHAMIGVRGFK